MNCPLHHIERVCRNVGGIKSLAIFLPEDVWFPAIQYCGVEAFALNNNIRLYNGQETYPIPFVKQSASFAEKQKETKAGIYYEQALVFEIPKDRREVARLIEKVKNRRIHATYVDNNGEQKLLQNMKVTADTTTKSERKDRNGYVFTLSSKTVKKAPFFIGTIQSVSGPET